MIVLLAAERYRQAQGRFPDKVTDLVPVYLSEAPIDPFDQKKLRIARFTQGITIYSVGPDGEDNGGQVDTKHPYGEPKDIGWRLWNVESRRQPPKPPEKDKAEEMQDQ